jgi:hypothetical protein
MCLAQSIGSYDYDLNFKLVLLTTAEKVVSLSPLAASASCLIFHEHARHMV